MSSVIVKELKKDIWTFFKMIMEFLRCHGYCHRNPNAVPRVEIDRTILSCSKVPIRRKPYLFIRASIFKPSIYL